MIPWVKICYSLDHSGCFRNICSIMVGSRNSDPYAIGVCLSATIAAPRFLCCFRVCQLCSAAERDGSNLNMLSSISLQGVFTTASTMSIRVFGHSTIVV